MTQKQWFGLLDEKIILKDGKRKILQNELVIRLRPDQETNDLKKLSRLWLLEVSEKAKKIKLYCKDNDIPFIMTDSGDGIDFHIFTSNMKTIVKQTLEKANNKLTTLPIMKMIIEQIIMVKSKITTQISVEIKGVKSSGEVLAIGSKNEKTESYKTIISSLSNKNYPGKSDVRFPKQVKRWKIPDDYSNELKRILKAQKLSSTTKNIPSTPDCDFSMVKDCYAYLDHQKETEVRLINPNKIGEVRNFFVNSVDELFDLIKRWSGKGFNFYVGINERSKGGKKGIDVTSIKTVVIDIDAVRVDNSLPEKESKKLPATKEELQLALGQAEIIIQREFVDKGFKEPIKCMSGNGYQLWCAIPEIKITDENRDEINAKIQAFNRLIRDKHSDPEYATVDNIGDLARVIKLIGTKSIKGKKDGDFRPHRLTYSESQLSRSEDPKLKNYILSLPVESTSTPTKKTKEKTVELKKEEALPVGERIKTISKKDIKLKKLLTGSIEGFPSRSEAEASILSKLIYYQFNKSEIFHIMNNSGCSKWKESHEIYKNRTYERILSFVKKKHDKFNAYLKGDDQKRFLGMMVKDFKKLREITKLVKKEGYIAYDGSEKPHKVYHITTQIPRIISKKECEKIIQESYNFEIEGEVSGSRLFNNKIVFLIKNLKVSKGQFDKKESIEKYLAKHYKASFPFKPHMTIAEGPKEKITEFYKDNKDILEKLVKGLKLSFQPVFITKDLGVNE